MTLALSALILCSALLQAGLGALLPFMGDEMPMSHTVESLHITGLAVGGLVAALLNEPVRRRLGRGRTLVVAAMLSAGGAVLLAAAPVPAVSALAMVLVGMGMSSTLITGQVLLVALHGRHGARMIGELNVAYSVGAVAASAVLPAVAASALGWRGFAAAPAVLMVALVVPLLVRGASRVPVDAPVVRAAAGGPAVTGPRAALAVMVLSVVVEWSFLFWLATHLTQVGGVGRDTAAGATAVMWLTVLAGRVLGSRVVGVVGPARVLGASLVVALLAIALLTVVRSPATAFLAGTVAGVAAANLYPASIALVVASDPARADRAVARGSLLASASTILAPLTLGALADAMGLRGSFAVVTTAFAVGALLLLGVSASRLRGAGRALPDGPTAVPAAHALPAPPAVSAPPVPHAASGTPRSTNQENPR